MTTKLSDDGSHYWDGTHWQPAVSADGRWKWNGEQWVANQTPSAHRMRQSFAIGTWVGAVVSVLLVLVCLVVFLTAIPAWIQGSHEAPGAIAGALLVVSFAVLLALPMGLRLANRRGAVAGASIVAGVLFLGSCGTGLALGAATSPSPSSNAVAVSVTRPSPSPRVVDTPPPSPNTRSIASPSASPKASPSQSPTSAPTRTPTPPPTALPTPPPTAAPPPPPPPPADTCGAPSNPWGYNFCGRGSLIYSPPSSFCTYFSPCVSTFWTATSGYVVQCASGSWSHSGGVSGACSRNGGVARVLYGGP